MIVHPSPFDSGHYGLQIGRVVPAAAEELRAGVADARAKGYDVVFVRIADDESALIRALRELGADPLETLVTLALDDAAPVPPTSAAIEIEHVARVDDPPTLEAIARITASAIDGTHLHRDARLPIDRTRALYAAWSRNDAQGRAQRMILGRRGGELVGYVSILRDGETAVIDLIAVDPAEHGRGIGTALLASFIGWVRAERLAGRVGTQSTNPALALYERCGFRVARRDLTYHLWL